MKDYNVIKEKCCRFYDESILPRYFREHYELQDCGYELGNFLSEMNLSLQEFKRYILMYSYGEGLDYMKEAYDTLNTVPEYQRLSPPELDFIMNCSQEQPLEKGSNQQIPNMTPIQEENKNDIR